jgi:hypothetical protein
MRRIARLGLLTLLSASLAVTVVPGVAAAIPEPTDPPPDVTLPAPGGDGPWVGSITRVVRDSYATQGDSRDDTERFVAHTVADGDPTVTTMAGGVAWHRHTFHQDYVGDQPLCYTKDILSTGSARIVPDFHVHVTTQGPRLDGNFDWGVEVGYPYVSEDNSLYGPVETLYTGTHVGNACDPDAPQTDTQF